MHKTNRTTHTSHRTDLMERARAEAERLEQQRITHEIGARKARQLYNTAVQPDPARGWMDGK